MTQIPMTTQPSNPYRVEKAAKIPAAKSAKEAKEKRNSFLIPPFHTARLIAGRFFNAKKRRAPRRAPFELSFNFF